MQRWFWKANPSNLAIWHKQLQRKRWPIWKALLKKCWVASARCENALGPSRDMTNYTGQFTFNYPLQCSPQWGSAEIKYIIFSKHYKFMDILVYIFKECIRSHPRSVQWRLIWIHIADNEVFFVLFFYLLDCEWSLVNKHCCDELSARWENAACFPAVTAGSVCREERICAVVLGHCCH